MFSDAVQFGFSALNADPAALLAVFPCQMLVVSLEDQTGHPYGFVIFIQGNHHK